MCGFLVARHLHKTVPSGFSVNIVELSVAFFISRNTLKRSRCVFFCQLCASLQCLFRGILGGKPCFFRLWRWLLSVFHCSQLLRGDIQSAHRLAIIHIDNEPSVSVLWRDYLCVHLIAVHHDIKHVSLRILSALLLFSGSLLRQWLSAFRGCLRCALGALLCLSFACLGISPRFVIRILPVVDDPLQHVIRHQELSAVRECRYG